MPKPQSNRHRRRHATRSVRVGRCDARSVTRHPVQSTPRGASEATSPGAAQWVQRPLGDALPPHRCAPSVVPSLGLAVLPSSEEQKARLERHPGIIILSMWTVSHANPLNGGRWTLSSMPARCSIKCPCLMAHGQVANVFRNEAFFVYIPLVPQNKGKKSIFVLSPLSSSANHTFVWVDICFNLVLMEGSNVVYGTFLWAHMIQYELNIEQR
ncbi:hypothetical protein C2845_PM13G20190 [Panicum miliaceum]|uniref:Uncharacterized protein n=1 Tax=Panicum miliaceum TaxID=4540 RepID=A0A3L6RFY2_PANMI|nr:hypothetical protein C2845_PM13G20190 [Panicum miliaceum]